MSTRWALAAALASAIGGIVAGCNGDEPLCCVEINPGEGLRALTCETDEAVVNCEAYDFSDCYYDRARDEECR